jgi:RimJ/RimL family protein N-acetyltransferase
LRLLQNEGAGQQQRVLENGLAAAVGEGQVQLLARPEVGKRHVVDGAGHACPMHDVDGERARQPLCTTDKGLRYHDVRRRGTGHAKRRGDRRSVDRERIVRAVLALRKGGRAGGEESDGRSREGPSEETHIPNNAAETANVAIRLMRRDDVDAFAGWAHHRDPLFRHYNLPALSPADADSLWAFLSGTPQSRRPYAALSDERMVAALMVRNMNPTDGSGELGIMIDPARLGQGLGRRILAAFVEVLRAEGFRRLHLEVAGYNGRAIAAYRASGFAVCDEYWADPEPGIDVASLLDGPAADAVSPNVRRDPDGRYRARIVRMERRLTPTMKDDLSL